MGSGFPSGNFCKPTKGELDPLVVAALQGRWPPLQQVSSTNCSQALLNRNWFKPPELPQVTAKDVRAEAAQTAK